MLRSLKELERYKVRATDGELGSVANFLFDDAKWTIRYLVVETGHIFDTRAILVSPISFREVDWAKSLFHLSLTTDELKSSPGIDADRPVSRQHERTYNDYYGYPHYWGMTGVWGGGYSPGTLGGQRRNEAPPESPAEEPGDHHLRSVAEVRGYNVQGSDHDVGFVADFIVDDETWELRYLVIDTSHWWWGKKVLVAPGWATRISWRERRIFVDLSREAVKNSPEWDASTMVRREYETRLYGHYGRRAYWSTKDRTDEARVT